MISLVYITCRDIYPFLASDLRHRSQYEVLAECLIAQDYQDFELIVVDEVNRYLPRPELTVFDQPVKYVRPPFTPWRRLGAFCAASARNAGLDLAEGDVVLGLDDCVSFDHRLLGLVADAAADGKYLVPAYIHERGTPVPNVRGGILAYPTQLARDLGGHEERFDGSMALEDLEFSSRLSRAGVRFATHPDAVVTLHAHPRLGGPNGEGRRFRCCYAVQRLVRDGEVANLPWTDEQLTYFTAPACPFRVAKERPEKRPLQWCAAGECQCLGDVRPTSDALAIMTSYESHSWRPSCNISD